MGFSQVVCAAASKPWIATSCVSLRSSERREKKEETSMTGILHPIEGVAYVEPADATRYFRTGAWIDHTVGDALRATARNYPTRHAFISDERSVTFVELDELTDRLGAALLDTGLYVGDRAIFQMGTTLETAIALLACYKIGVIPVCSVPQYREIEIGHLTRQSSARGYFIQADFGNFDLIAFARQMIARHDSLAHLIAARTRGARGETSLESLIERTSLDYARKRLENIHLGSQDVLSFQLSGGTTGVPKIIPRFHGEYLGQSRAWMKQCAMTSSSRLIWSLPLLHNAGQLYALMPAIASGVTTVLMPKVDIRRMLELIELHRVTHAMSIGPIAPQMMVYRDVGKHNLSSLQLFATLSRADALEAYLGVPCSNLFGITEGLLLGTPAHAPAEARHRTQGASGCPDDEIRLLQPESETPVNTGEMGELCFRGPSSLRGFYNAPEANRNAFTRDGFYRTGDMMTAHVIDGSIYYAFEGRLRDNINRGGEKIGCEEVEAFVSMHPAIADAKLVAMPDEFYGEKACAFVILRPDQRAPDVKELAGFLVGKGLAKFKCPERIEILEAFPLTRIGKVDKPALKAAIALLTEKEAESRARADANGAQR
jgi:non-ribosomal peptide synthetase component E (peptide arylation enzyme)